ncbi:GrpB family protein [Actinokineospora diospyrosa]|uniref:Dephospho-CoA kinase n=1 Tax=Actinokineospora diospyrosa TaxID=103728 RepID=A0ABT1IED5_9PSEU|nr:GrpB family protein [Actinokineospora diospyrosa]MCP2271001.1 dephospho-CoA kinase [Actinokineospora diospyrosa]
MEIAFLDHPGARALAAHVRGLDRDGWVRVGDPLSAVFVIAPGVVAEADAVADSVAAVTALWTGRVGPFARNLAERRFAPAVGPPVLSPSSPEWPVTAARLLRRLVRATRGLPRAGEFTWDHIGSTSVPGLAAKAVVDLQLGVPSLDEVAGLCDAVLAAGFVDVARQVPDSPGVLTDMVRNWPDPGASWGKRLFASGDPGCRSILHVREIGSPWWSLTRGFRDLLRVDAGLRAEYERTKRDLTRVHARDEGNDAYTRSKTAFFDRVHHRLVGGHKG